MSEESTYLKSDQTDARGIQEFLHKNGYEVPESGEPHRIANGKILSALKDMESKIEALTMFAESEGQSAEHIIRKYSKGKTDD